MSAEAQMSLAPERPIEYPKAVPDSAGIPAAVRNNILIAPFNDVEVTRSIIEKHANEIAGLIVEPLQRIVPPQPGFLQFLREICDKFGIVLIFDEIVTGFRLAYGGAQEIFGITPDLCTLGKIIGGGFALSAITGRSEIMTHFDKNRVGSTGFLMQVGTLSGNPVAAVAGLKTLEILRCPGQFDRLQNTGRRIQRMLSEPLTELGIAHQIVGVPALFDLLFTDQPVCNYWDTVTGEATLAAQYNWELRKRGIFKSPVKLYVSLALTDDDLSQIGDAARQAAKSLA